MIKKIFKRPQAVQWNIVDKETADEIIFRTMNIRNRLMLELVARGGMRVGEVLNLTPVDIQERTLAISGKVGGKSSAVEILGFDRSTLCTYMCKLIINEP